MQMRSTTASKIRTLALGAVAAAVVMGAAEDAGAQPTRPGAAPVTAPVTQPGGPTNPQLGYGPPPALTEEGLRRFEQECAANTNNVREGDESPQACAARRASNITGRSSGNDFRQQACSSAEDAFQRALEGLGRYCPAAAASMGRRAGTPQTTPATGSTRPSVASRAIDECTERLRECQSQEDTVDDEVERAGANTSLADLSLGTSCNEMAAAQAEDLKTEGEDLEKQIERKQNDITEAQRKANEAEAEHQRKLTELQSNHEQQQQQLRRRIQELGQTWAQRQQQANSQLAQESLKATEALATLTDRMQTAIRTYTAAQAQHRNVIRSARSECEKRAAGLMRQLEGERRAATRAFTNNTGSLRALTGSVERFRSRYAQDLNNCLATDYKRTVDASYDGLALQRQAFETAKQNVESAQRALEKQLAVGREQLNAQLKVEYDKLQQDEKNIVEEQNQAKAVYDRNVAQAQAESASRKQTEQREAFNLQQQLQRLQGRAQTNADRQAQLRIPNPGPATTRSAGRRRTNADQGLEKLLSYQSAYCRFETACRRPPIGPAPSGGCPGSGMPAATRPTTGAPTGTVDAPRPAGGG